MNSPVPTPPSPENVTESLLSVAASAEAATHAHVIAPVFDAARRMGTITCDVIDKTREQLAKQVTHVEESASQRYDRSAKWVSANPISALGIGFAVGMLITQAFGRTARH